MGHNMRNKYKIASLYFFLAENSLRGLKAWAWRVTAEWLKTPCLVLSRDYLAKDGLFPEDCGCVPTNPTKDALLNFNRMKYE